MKNMEYYDAVREAPTGAVKKIGAGAYGAAGLSDINPQWRIEAMTMLFGPVGTGWKWEPVEIFEREGVLYAHVIVTYRTVDGEWSESIHGYGGTKFGGRDDSDIYKSTLTDALSYALRFIGIGANVWFDPKKSADKNQFDTKYSTAWAPAKKPESAPNPHTEPEAPQDEAPQDEGPVIREEPQGVNGVQVKVMRRMVSDEEWAALEGKYGTNLAMMSKETYVKVLAKIKERKANEGESA